MSTRDLFTPQSRAFMLMLDAADSDSNGEEVNHDGDTLIPPREVVNAVYNGMGNKVTDDEVAEVMADLVKPGTRIEFAERREVENFDYWVDKVLAALGYPNAWVTDLSMVHDFFCMCDEAEQQRRLALMSEQLGTKVTMKDYIHDIAKRIAAVH